MQRKPGSPTVHQLDVVGQRARAAELLDEADALVHEPPYTERKMRQVTALTDVAYVRMQLADVLDVGGESK